MVKYFEPVAMTILFGWIILLVIILIRSLISGGKSDFRDSTFLDIYFSVVLSLTALFIAVLGIYGIVKVLIWIWAPYL